MGKLVTQNDRPLPARPLQCCRSPTTAIGTDRQTAPQMIADPAEPAGSPDPPDPPDPLRRAPNPPPPPGHGPRPAPRRPAASHAPACRSRSSRALTIGTAAAISEP